MSNTKSPQSAHYCEQISPKEYKKEADEYTKRELEKLFEYLAKHPEAKKRSKTLSQLPLEISPATSPKKLVQQHDALFSQKKNDESNGNHIKEQHTTENRTSGGISPELLDLRLLEVKYGVRKATTIERLLANIIDSALLLTIWWLYSNGQESAVIFGLIIWLMCSGQTLGKKLIGIHVGLEPFGTKTNIYLTMIREFSKFICIALFGWNLDPFLYTCVGKFSYDFFNKTNVYRSLRKID
jgi:hypothetical protein